MPKPTPRQQSKGHLKSVECPQIPSSKVGNTSTAELVYFKAIDLFRHKLRHQEKTLISIRNKVDDLLGDISKSINQLGH